MQLSAVAPISPAPTDSAIIIASRSGDVIEFLDAEATWRDGAVRSAKGSLVVSDLFQPRDSREFVMPYGDDAGDAALGAALLRVEDAKPELLAQLAPIDGLDAFAPIMRRLPQTSTQVAIALEGPERMLYGGLVDLAKLSAPAREALEGVRSIAHTWPEYE